MTGWYIHIPFCVRKCIYCDFYSVETPEQACGNRSCPPEPLPDQTRFLDALEQELRSLPKDFAPATIFVGGGTPTELSEPNLQRMLDLILAHARLPQVREWTSESNPGTLTSRKARMLKDAGVNRVSLGVQSFDHANLRFLGRQHGPDDVYSGYALLRDTGFDNINLDLMYGIPGSDLDKTRADVEQIITLNPEHVSCYCLTFEDGTPLMAMKQYGHVAEVDDESARHQYRTIRDILKTAGYEQYEISNYARPGYACRHNLLYWGNGEYMGNGPAAHSHWRGRRYANVRDLIRYCESLLHGQAPIDFEEELAPAAKARETLVMGLRRLAGVKREEFRHQTGHDYRELAGTAIDQLCAIGMLEEVNDTLRLTDAGIFVSDSVFAELV